MSNFTTRVELHKAQSSEDYNKLHEEMEKEGFTRTVSSESGSYKLPTAEYNYSHSTLDTNEVRDLAKRAANRTGKEFSILVTKANGVRSWYNLDKA